MTFEVTRRAIATVRATACERGPLLSRVAKSSRLGPKSRQAQTCEREEEIGEITGVAGASRTSAAFRKLLDGAAHASPRNDDPKGGSVKYGRPHWSIGLAFRAPYIHPLGSAAAEGFGFVEPPGPGPLRTPRGAGNATATNSGGYRSQGIRSSKIASPSRRRSSDANPSFSSTRSEGQLLGSTLEMKCCTECSRRAHSSIAWQASVA
jgi:hypothetical protein